MKVKLKSDIWMLLLDFCRLFDCSDGSSTEAIAGKVSVMHFYIGEIEF